MIYFASLYIKIIIEDFFILKIIEQELTKFDKVLSDCLMQTGNEILPEIKNFIFSKSKKLRPKIIFLYAKALEIEVSENIINLAICTELLHNSTLIHDDIIDDAKIRRGKLSLNQKLGNNLSVLAGDYLLSLAMQFLAKCNNIKCFETFANSLKLMCEGEINQHYTLGKIPSMDEYIRKSSNKTAELFKASLISFSILTGTEQQNAEDFAQNFGIAFQIRDDLTNILENDVSKPSLSDIHNKIYNAPVIFLNKDIKDLTENEIIEQVQTQEIKEKTIKLIKKYVTKAIASLDFIKDNQYKQEMIKLCEDLYRAV